MESIKRLHALEKRQAIGVLLFVRQHPSCTRKALYRELRSSTRIVASRIDELVGIGLLKEEIETSGYRAHKISLTDAGRKVADHLVKIEMIVRDLGRYRNNFHHTES